VGRFVAKHQHVLVPLEIRHQYADS
jgi:hypothetical protein